MARHGDRVQHTKKRAAWLVKWLQEVVTAGSVLARICPKDGGGGSAICLVLHNTGEDGPDEATRDAKGIDGERLQRPDVGVQGAIPLVFYTDAKAEDGRAWIGGFLEISRMPGTLVLAGSGEGLGTLGFCQRGYEEGYCRP